MLIVKVEFFHSTLPSSAILLCLVSRVLAGTWIYPDPETSHTFNRTDTLNATWGTTFDQPDMVLWCQTTGAARLTAEFNISVPGAGSHIIDLSKYGNETMDCHLEVAETGTALHSLSSPDFHVNDLQSNPPTTWALSDASNTPTASLTSFPDPVNSTLPADSDSTTPSSTSATSSGAGSVTIPIAESAISSPAPVQKTEALTGLSVGAAVGISLGAAMIVITLLATFWYLRRSHNTSDTDQLGDLAAVKAAELESARALTDSTHSKPQEYSYPVGVGDNRLPPAQELEGRPYWGRPF